MRIISVLVPLVVSCGMNVKVKDSRHDVNVNNSEQTITVRTTLDRIMEVCGIVAPNGITVPYSEWTQNHKDCLAQLDTKGLVDEQYN